MLMDENTLSPACKMETGNDGSGLELSHIRKFGSTSVSGWDILRIKNNIILNISRTLCFLLETNSTLETKE